MPQANEQTLQRAAIVTGATGGIGQALARALYADGYTVICACRTPARLGPLTTELEDTYPGSGGKLIGATLDLSTTSGARRGANEIADIIDSHTLNLHAIINNAGTMPVDHLAVSPDGMEMTLQVNCISTLSFTLPLLPLLQPGGVVVMTSSLMRRFPRLREDFAEKSLHARNVVQRFNNYGRSKQLLTYAARHLADIMSPKRIRVNCADPGIVDSGIIRLGYPLVDKIADLIARPVMSTTQQGAQAALNAMSAQQTATMATRRHLSTIPPLTDRQRAVVNRILRQV